MSTNITVSPTAESHAATLRQPRRALPAEGSEPQPVRADLPPHPAWCVMDWDPTEVGDQMEHSSDHRFIPLSLPNLDAEGLTEAERYVRYAWYREAATERGIDIEPYRPSWLVHLSQPYGGQPVIWLGRDESNRGADMTPAEAEALGRHLLALAAAGREGAGR